MIVEFPLRGDWWATNTPARRVPSHGTDYFGQRYAYDFVRMDPTSTWFYGGEASAMARHVTIGISASAFFGWAQPVHAVFSGTVAAVGDDYPDRERVHFFWEMIRPFIVPPLNTKTDHRPLAGNYVILEGDGVYAFYAHLRRGSVAVAVGEQVATGDLIGNVGNSGNTTMPHLHFHLMDSADPLKAKGVECAFRRYERWNGDRWEAVENGMPASMERIRVQPS